MVGVGAGADAHPEAKVATKRQPAMISRTVAR
jgi:hypothetical protein